jgi:hypothetical protein
MPSCVECGSEAEAHPRPLCAPCLESLIRYDLGWRMGLERSRGVFYLSVEQSRGGHNAYGRALDRCFRQYAGRWQWATP